MFTKETPQDTFFFKKKSINCDGKLLKLDEPMIMGILNLTPDSFFDGGKYHEDSTIVQHVGKMLAQGAKIIDVGGHSSRPGAIEITEKEELNRVIHIIKLLKQEFDEIIISIDTFRANVAYQAIKNGASIVNDISSGNIDNKMFDTISELKVPYVLMHMQGNPQTMQLNPTYNNVTDDVIKFFSKKIEQLNKKGVTEIILDPGFGFGKTIKHNYELLSNLEAFKIFELPLLAGFSRKSMITKVLNIKPEEGLNGTTILNTLAITKGTNILRVHDVKEAQQIILLNNEMKKYR